MTDRLLTTPEVADLLGSSPDRVAALACRRDSGAPAGLELLRFRESEERTTHSGDAPAEPGTASSLLRGSGFCGLVSGLQGVSARVPS